jgi:hypothetical protein
MPLGQAKTGLLVPLQDFGMLELIETQTFTNVSYVDFNSIEESTYGTHMFMFNVDKTSARLDIQFFENGVIENGGVYHYSRKHISTATDGDSKGTTLTGITLDTSGGYTVGFGYVFNAGDSTKHTLMREMNAHIDTIPNHRTHFGAFGLPQKSVVDGFRFIPTSNTISGTISIYGIKEGT